MSQIRLVPDTEENAKRCRCPECPVYNECLDKKNEVLFCSRGRTECNIEKKGCLCLYCPNENEYTLNSLFYCEKGFATRNI